MTKILILGSEGFLGSVLTPYLLKNNGHFEITGVDKCFFGMNNKRNKKFKFYKKDYNQLSKNFFQKFEIIIDLVNISNDPASELNKRFTYQTNYTNKLKLYSKIRNLKNISRYIYMSSCSVYGNNKNLINEKSKPKPQSKEKFVPPLNDIAEYMSLEEIKEYLLEDDDLTDEERFDLYYEEHRRVQDEKNSMSYDELLKKSGLLPPEKN